METQFLADHQEKLGAMGSELQQMRGGLKDLGKRLDILERQHAATLGRPESEAAAELRTRREEAEEEALVKESLTLVDGTDSERSEAWRAREDASLSPEEAKTQYQQDREDEVWVDGMIRKGGQNA